MLIFLLVFIDGLFVYLAYSQFELALDNTGPVRLTRRSKTTSAHPWLYGVLASIAVLYMTIAVFAAM